MRGLFGSFVLAATLLAAAWANHHHHHGHAHHDHQQHDHAHHDHAHHDHAHHDHAHHDHTEAEMSCRRLAPHNADFAFALYKNLKDKTPAGKNIFFSPLGITTALSMLSTGAGGETHSQLFSTLGYSPLTQAQVDESYEHLFHMLGHSQEDQLLNVGNAAAVRTGFTPREKFLSDIKKFYSGDILNTDFTNPSEAAAQINRYIAGKTNDKITDLVKDLDPATALVLINYVLFRGQWEKPFNADQTTREEFHVDENTKVQVDMMHRTGRYGFYESAEDHVTVILLPYKGNTSMLVVLPDEGRMNEVEGIICRNHLKSWHDKVERNSVELSLPKFSISAEASLDSSLKELGIIRAFADDAEFNGISTEVPLKVSKVAHQAVLSVDETGTEAAAATTIEVMPMSMPKTIKLNRPFLVFIVEHSTRSILFMGKITNPTI